MSATEQMNTEQLVTNAHFLHAYLECSDKIQEAVRDLLRIVFSDESTKDECHMALVTIADALFPNFHKGKLGVDLEEMREEAPTYVPELQPVVEALDREEAEFATRLKSFLAMRNMPQSELAKKIGVTQPAISLMLNRQCRPQYRTIERLADALDIHPENLWSEYTASDAVDE